MGSRRIALSIAATALVACQRRAAGPTPLPTVAVIRQDIAVRVQATGTVEPINPVDVKSRAQGLITKMAVEVGNMVKAGDLLAQIDPRDVQNQFSQATADDVVARASLDKSRLQQQREDSLFARHVITAVEHDSARSASSTAQAQMVSSRAALDLARQALEDATLHAPISGTVISRPITQGQIITSALSASGGTTLMTIADLGRVRMRVYIDEVEMANVRVGETATARVDAFPDHPFDGVIEKIEPQATVTQGVTFFPVLVSVDNKDGLLMPGMNGEVTIRAADLQNALQVPIDAIRPTNELAPLARMFGIPIDTLTNSLRRDLTAGEGTTGIPGRYVVAALPDGSYEMRLVKVGPTDLRVQQVLDGVKQGERVLVLGAILTGRPPVPPKLQIAENMRRGAPAAQSVQAGKAAPAGPGQPTTQTGKPTPSSGNLQAGKAVKP
jgi:HlyD family secretion protein